MPSPCHFSSHTLRHPPLLFLVVFPCSFPAEGEFQRWRARSSNGGPLLHRTRQTAMAHSEEGELPMEGGALYSVAPAPPLLCALLPSQLLCRRHRRLLPDSAPPLLYASSIGPAQWLAPRQPIGRLRATRRRPHAPPLKKEVDEKKKMRSFNISD